MPETAARGQDRGLHRSRFVALAALAVVGLVVGACATAGAPAAPGAMATTAPHSVDPAIHKIQHVVVIQQENRSFDSYFGTYPGADGLPSGACVPAPNGGPCVAPYPDHADVNGAGPHGASNAAADVDRGKMDGFVAQAASARRGALSC